MPATPSTSIADADKVKDLAHELAPSCPQASAVLLTLSACMLAAAYDGQALRTLVITAMAVSELVQLTCEANIRHLREIAESN